MPAGICAAAIPTQNAQFAWKTDDEQRISVFDFLATDLPFEGEMFTRVRFDGSCNANVPKIVGAGHGWTVVAVRRRDGDTSALPPNAKVPEIMIEQLDFVQEMSQLSNVKIRVMPLLPGGIPVLKDFNLIEPRIEPGKSGLTVVHLENRRSGLAFHEDEDVATYRSGIDTLREVTMSLI